MTLYRWLATALLVAVCTVAGNAHTDSGRFSGTVFDESGGTVANATVIAKNDKTGEVRAVTTNTAGYFVITPLKPAPYTITATKEGFGVQELPGLPIAVGQELPIDFTLKPAGVQ